MRGAQAVRNFIRPARGAGETAARGRTAKRIRRTIGQLGLWRIALALVLLVVAVLIARFSWSIPLVVDAERALYDMRATIEAPYVPQDRRITLVTYNDDTLIDSKVRSPLDRGLLARALAELDTMGAASIGIDIVIDQPTDNDDALRAQLRAMRTPTFVAYASPADEQGQYHAATGQVS